MRQTSAIAALLTLALSFQAYAVHADTDRYVSEGRPRVIGGSPAKLSSWPAIGTLRYYNEVTKLSGHVCGGTMIAPTWMLTAAHCLARLKEKGTLTGCYADDKGKSQCGELQVVLNHDDLSTPVSAHGIADLVVHEEFMTIYREARNNGLDPEYSTFIATTSSGHDIALVRLKEPWSGELVRLSLAPTTDPRRNINDDLRVAGFGFLSPTHEKRNMRRYIRSGSQAYFAGSDLLLSAKVPMVDTARCANKYHTKYSSAVIGDGQICAGTEAGGTDSCQGDSGGPLMAYDNQDQKYQVGLVSWGEGCAEPGWYGIYTRISAHAAWLRSKVGKLKNEPVSATSHVANVTAPRLVEAALDQLQTELAPVQGLVTMTIPGGPHVKLGREYSFEISSSVSGRLVVVDIDAGGKVTQIVPNAFMDQSASTGLARIEAGTTMTVPPPDGSWGFLSFRAAPPTGHGRTLVLVVPDSFPFEATVWSKQQQLRTKGFEPSPPQSYLMNLVDQVIHTLSTMRSASGEVSPRGWAWTVVETKIEP